MRGPRQIHRRDGHGAARRDPVMGNQFCGVCAAANMIRAPVAAAPRDASAGAVRLHMVPPNRGGFDAEIRQSDAPPHRIPQMISQSTRSGLRNDLPPRGADPSDGRPQRRHQQRGLPAAPLGFSAGRERRGFHGGWA